MRSWLLLVCVGALSCSLSPPELPPSDALLDGVYLFTWSENSRLRAHLAGATLEFTAGGGVTLHNPDFQTDRYGVVDVVESGTYSFVELEPDSGVLMLDITSQAPPALAGAYVFHGGLNRIQCVRRSGAQEEILRLRLVPDGSTRAWAQFVRRSVPRVAGDYAFVRSTSSDVARLLDGAFLSLGADSTFLLENPVSVRTPQGDSTIVATESGTYSVSLDSIRFSVVSQQPSGADSLFLLRPPSLGAAVGFVGDLLAISFSVGSRVDSTYWAAPTQVAESEPNDTRETATPVGARGPVLVTGTVSSGGVGPQGYRGDLDFFSFTPGAALLVRVDLWWDQPADLDLVLTDARGDVVARSVTVSQAPPERLEARLEPGGEYFLLVASVDNPSPYRLKLRIF